MADCELKEMHLARAREQWEALPVLDCTEVTTLRIPCLQPTVAAISLSLFVHPLSLT